MFRSEESRDCLRGLIGWKDHFDLTDIPALGAALNDSESGEYYQEKHPAVSLELISAMLPEKILL